MFEDFYSKLEKKPTQPLISVQEYLSDNILINPDMVYNKLNNMSNIPDADLFKLLKDSYKSILSSIFLNESDYIKFFTNSRFLIIFTQVISSVNIDYINKIYCNKLAYDYLTSENPDQYLKQLYYSLSKIVNRDTIPALLSLGIPEDLASYIALSRYSSQNEMVNVKRVNFILISSSNKIMTEQTIVYIYEKLFDRFTPLFEATMFDIYGEEDGFTEEMQEIYSIISLAVLDIMNNMTSVDIRKVLISYAGDYAMLYYVPGKKCIRFSMRNLSEDYQRITNVVESLSLENTFVP